MSNSISREAKSSISLRNSLQAKDWEKVRELLSTQSFAPYQEQEDAVLRSGDPSLPSCMDDEVEYMTDAIQCLFFNSNDIPSDIFTLFSKAVDLRHVIPSLRANYDPRTIYYSCLIHELCLDNKYEAIRLLLRSLPVHVAAQEAQRLDYMYIEYMSDDHHHPEDEIGQRGPGAISGFEFIHSPLQVAWEGTLFDTKGQKDLYSISSIEDLKCDAYQDIAALWKCTMLLLSSAGGISSDHLKGDDWDNVSWPVLHTIARIGCKGHAAIMWLALKLYPQLLREVDQDGNLAIHVAAQNSLHYLSQRSQQDSKKESEPLEVAEPSNDNKTFVANNGGAIVATSHTESFLAKGQKPTKSAPWQQPPIIMMLEKDPESAAIPDRNGSLPLHQFLSHHDTNVDKIREQKDSHEHCMGDNFFDGYHMSSLPTAKALIAAHPSALVKPDVKTGLHPFMLAASTSTISLDVIYFLLSENPIYIVSDNYFVPSQIKRRIVTRKRSLSFYEEREDGEKNKLSMELR